MININKSGNGVAITFQDNQSYYIPNGNISLPLNSVSLVLDTSDMVTFKLTSNGDYLFAVNLNELTIGGTQATRANVDSLYASTMTGSSGDETDPVFTAWKNSRSIVAGWSSSNNTANDSVIIGSYTNSITKNQIIALGTTIYVDGASSIAIGGHNEVYGASSIAIGNGARVMTNNSVAIGTHAVVDYGDYIDTAPVVSFGRTSSGRTARLINVSNGINSTDAATVGQLPVEWIGTQAQYDALGSYDNNTTYYITD